MYNAECVARGDPDRTAAKIIEKVEKGCKCLREVYKGTCDGSHHRKDHDSHVFWNIPQHKRFRQPSRFESREEIPQLPPEFFTRLSVLSSAAGVMLDGQDKGGYRRRSVRRRSGEATGFSTIRGCHRSVAS